MTKPRPTSGILPPSNVVPLRTKVIRIIEDINGKRQIAEVRCLIISVNLNSSISESCGAFAAILVLSSNARAIEGVSVLRRVTSGAGGRAQTYWKLDERTVGEMIVAWVCGRETVAIIR